MEINQSKSLDTARSRAHATLLDLGISAAFCFTFFYPGFILYQTSHLEGCRSFYLIWTLPFSGWKRYPFSPCLPAILPPKIFCWPFFWRQSHITEPITRAKGHTPTSGAGRWDSLNANHTEISKRGNVGQAKEEGTSHYKRTEVSSAFQGVPNLPSFLHISWYDILIWALY